HVIAYAKVLERSQLGFQNRLQHGPAEPAEAHDFAGARVVDQRRGNLREVRFMLLAIILGAVQPLLFACEQNEANGSLWLHARLGENAGGFERDAGAGAVVESALAQVPRIKMSADDDTFVRLFAADDFTDGVIDGYRT